MTCGFSIKVTSSFLLHIGIPNTKKILRVLLKIGPFNFSTEEFQISMGKELSLRHKLRFYNPYIFVAQCRRPLIFQTINSGRSNNQSLKYQRFTPTSCKDIGIRKFELVTISYNSMILSEILFYKDRE